MFGAQALKDEVAVPWIQLLLQQRTEAPGWYQGTRELPRPAEQPPWQPVMKSSSSMYGTELENLELL